MQSREMERAIRDVLNDTCPRCAGELDTGWECNVCDFDAMLLGGLAKDWVESHPEDQRIRELVTAWGIT